MYVFGALEIALGLSCLSAHCAQNIVLTNDDGWAVAAIRAQYEALTDPGFNVVLSAPAENQSGMGSLSKTPTPLDLPCEYNSCPAGSPAEGYNETDPHLNYVNAYPVDAARYGIQTLAPQFFDGSPPALVVSGPNIGNNLGLVVLLSGTVGAACEAAKSGIPAVAFSGASGSEVSYTTLESTPNASSTLAARIYAELGAHFVAVLAESSAAPLLPPGVVVNVNYPAIDACASAADFGWVFSRLVPDIFAQDVETCGSKTLPTESSVVGAGCYASVSVLSATSKLDVNSTLQAAVLERLNGLPLSCMPN